VERINAALQGKALRGFVAVSVADPTGATPTARRIQGLPDGSAPDEDQPVLVASFTKLWTAVAVLRVVERHELTLETTIADALPSLAKRPWADSTLRELMTHTSRVPEFDEKGGYYRQAGVDFTDPIVALAAYVPRDRTEARGTFKYRNAEFAILGAILAARTGVPADQALAHEVFEPARMTHSGLLVKRGPSNLDLTPVGHVRAQNFFTAGAGYASPRDLLRFFEALAGSTLLDVTSKALLFDGSTSRGHGALGCWASPFGDRVSRRTLEGERGPLLVERPGSFGNVRLFSAFFPELGRAIVVWSSEPVEMGNARAGRGIGHALARALTE
jgi:CubicO group peptidase (beta-lactamase class C family)